MVSVKDIGERGLIHKAMNIIRPYPHPGQRDDAVVIDDNTVVCTDIVSFDRHLSEGMSYEEFGWMAVAVNFSDLASMGAVPKYFLSAVSIPENLDEKNFTDIISGMEECAEACDAYIVGGDTKFGQGLIAGTAIGSLEDRKPLLRSGARPGDIVAVTGSLGSAAAGYFSLKNKIDGIPLSSLRTPIPRIKEGIALSKSGAVTSCTDLSDGLAEGAKCICFSSHTGMDIHMEFIPEGEGVSAVSDALSMDKKDLVLYWGGDYELLFTFDKRKIDLLYDYDIDFSVIGMVTNDKFPFISHNGERRVIRSGRY
jgi:thiamine-monophosphate kinase